MYHKRLLALKAPGSIRRMLLMLMVGMLACLSLGTPVFADEVASQRISVDLSLYGISGVHVDSSTVKPSGMDASTDFGVPATDSEAPGISAFSLQERGSSGVLPLVDNFLFHQSEARSMLSMVNELRSLKGVSALAWNADLEATAMQRAAEIVYYFDASHNRPDGSSCFTAYPSWVTAAGENIAKGALNATSAFDGWVKSPGHYANMIDASYDSIGIACVEYYGQMYWVQAFGGGGTGGAAGTALDGYSYVVFCVPDSFARNVTYDGFTRNIGVSNEADLPTVTVVVSGSYNPKQALSGSVGYASDMFSWDTGAPSVVSVSVDEDMMPHAIGVDIGSTTLQGTLLTSNRVAANVPVRVGKARRLDGEIRYDTMASIVKESFTSSSWAIVTSGDTWPDSLAAAGLAGSYEAPIIITDKGALSAQAEQELIRLGVSHVFVVGGPEAVSQQVENQIKNIVGANGVKRVAGDTRLSTSVAVAREIYAHEGSTASKTVVLASSQTFADGLSCSPYAYAQSCPILLVDPDRLTSEAISVIRSAGVNRVIIMGGTAAINSSVETQLNAAGFHAIERYGGDTRYETTIAFADFACHSGVLSTNNITWALGENFPDALTGGALAGKNRSVLILTDGKSVYSPTLQYAKGKTVQQGYVLGGVNAISNEVMGGIFNALQ